MTFFVLKQFGTYLLITANICLNVKSNNRSYDLDFTFLSQFQVESEPPVLVPHLGHPKAQGGDGGGRRQGHEPRRQLQVDGAAGGRGNGERVQRRLLRGPGRGGQRLGQHRGAHLHGPTVRVLQQTPARVRHSRHERKHSGGLCFENLERNCFGYILSQGKTRGPTGFVLLPILSPI